GQLITYYSIDGSTPGTSYWAPFEIDRTRTVKSQVRELQPNNTWSYSAIVEQTVVLKVGTPVIGLASGEYDPGTAIQITSCTPGAVLRYRLDGQPPSDSDPQIPSDGELLVGNFTLSVRAFYQYMDPSDVATATYTIPWNYNTGGIAGGLTYSAALTPDGTVWSWGSNTVRQLGYGERWKENGGPAFGELVVSQANSPQVRTLTGVRAIAIGSDNTPNYGGFTVALREDGTVWTWGSTFRSQLGRSTCETDYNSLGGYCVRPGQVGLTDIVAVAARGHHALALRADGTVWAWGANTYGQLGDGTTTDSPTPQQVLGVSGVVAIAAGYEYSLALTADGTVWGWGYNALARIIREGTDFGHSA
ncbi:MAG: hypothetical protein HYU37_08415, partial [Acidobacteria bacterium]|nr:hypothetical protein [Acidobacteriota bacterium]